MKGLEGLNMAEVYEFLRVKELGPRFAVHAYEGALPIRNPVEFFNARNDIRFAKMGGYLNKRREADPQALGVGRWIDQELRAWAGVYRKWQEGAAFQTRALTAILKRMEATRGCDGVLGSGKTIDTCGVCGGISACAAKVSESDVLLHTIIFDAFLLKQLTALYALLDPQNSGYISEQKLLSGPFQAFFGRIGSPEFLRKHFDKDSSASVDPHELLHGFVSAAFQQTAEYLPSGANVDAMEFLESKLNRQISDWINKTETDVGGPYATIVADGWTPPGQAARFADAAAQMHHFEILSSTAATIRAMFHKLRSKNSDVLYLDELLKAVHLIKFQSNVASLYDSNSDAKILEDDFLIGWKLHALEQSYTVLSNESTHTLETIAVDIEHKADAFLMEQMAMIALPKEL
jgi:hypothetical protein